MATTQRAGLEMLGQGLEMALRGVRSLLDAADPEDSIDQKRSPLGARQHCEAARTCRLVGVRNVGGKWLVKRRHLGAFIESHPAGDPPGEAVEQGAILEYRAPRRRRASSRGRKA